MGTRVLLCCAIVVLGWFDAVDKSVADDCTLTEQSIMCGCAITADPQRIGQAVDMDGGNMVVGGGRLWETWHFKRVAGIVTYADGIWSQHHGFAGGSILDDGFVEHFHANVAIDGVWAMMGDPQFGDQYVRVANYNGQSWSDEGLILPSDPDAGDRFGSAVAISGDVAIVGARKDGELQRGSASLFRYIGDPGQEEWTQEQLIYGSSNEPNGLFGHDVAIRGDVAVVGVPGHPGITGKACVYRYDSGQSSWQKEGADIVPSGSQIGDEVGYSVAIGNDGLQDVIVIGVPDAHHESDRPGAAYVYKYTGGVWGEPQQLLASDPEHNMRFGCSADIDGDTVVVGARYKNAMVGDVEHFDAGAAYVFKLNGSLWEEEAKLLPSEPDADDHFGVSVAVRGDKFLIGAAGKDVGAGAVYYFDPLAFDCNDNGEYDDCECIADLNDDDVIDIDDLFVVLASWGPCDECCPDLDQNGDVDIGDIFLILARWGPCSDPGSVTPPQSIYDCMEYIGDPQKFQTCVEAMTRIGAGGGQ